MKTVSIEFPEEVVELYKEDELKSSVRKWVVLELVKNGKLSSEKAAEILGMTGLDFMELMSNFPFKEKKSFDSEDIESILKNGEEHIFEVVIEPDEDVYYAYCPDLQGCRTWGHTRKEALRYIQEAVELYVADLIADGKPVPGIGLVSNIAPIVKLKESKEASL